MIIKFFQALKRLKSYTTRQPVFKDHQLTGGVHIDQDPTNIDPQALVFFRLRSQIGVFEVIGVEQRNGVTHYLLHNTQSDLKFRISKNLFEHLFEQCKPIPNLMPKLKHHE